MIKTSEYVSLGHPDKTADYISEWLLDRYIERDPNTRYAVEVQIKGNFVTLGGEITSDCHFESEEIAEHVRDAVRDIGYTREYQDKWGEENTICGDDLNVTAYINQQSPDIARGVDKHGWGDQGIFYGMATSNAFAGNMPEDYALAKRICQELFYSGIGGLDIKTLVSMEDGILRKVVVAIPLLYDKAKTEVEEYVRGIIRHHIGLNCEVIINGTGRYVQHSTIADCGTTGRKLAVDFYGGNCVIGGGSPWTKDGTKADLTLNLYARDLALDLKVFKRESVVYTAVSCVIGSSMVEYVAWNKDMQVLETDREDVQPQELIKRYRLDTPIYAKMCREGLFGEKKTR